MDRTGVTSPAETCGEIPEVDAPSEIFFSNDMLS